MGIGDFLSDLARSVVSPQLGTANPTDPRAQAVAALCTQRGLVPGPLLNVPMVLAAFSADFFGFESSFVAPDGSLWAREFWARDKTQSQNTFYSQVTFTVAGVRIPYVAVVRKGELPLPGVARGQTLQLESTDFDNSFGIRTEDQRAAMMLLDQGMMQWLLDCDRVSLATDGDRWTATVVRESSPVGEDDPTELQLAFRFHDGFATRVPQILRSEYPATS